MKATAIKDFPGRPDDERTTREIKKGEEITGELAAAAVAAGLAKKAAPSAKVSATKDDDSDSKTDKA